MRFPLWCAAAALALPAGAVGQEKAPIDLREWLVPWEQSRPRDPYAFDATTIWFVGQRSHYAAYLDVETGDFRRYELGDGVGPHNLIVDSDGFVWYSGNRDFHIGKLDPRNGEIARFRTESRDPHTLVFDHNGDIWFTAQQSNRIGKLSVATEQIVELDVATERARPYGIKVDSKNRPWIALFGTNKIATVDENMRVREITLPHERTRPRRLEITSDDRVWWTDYTRGYLGMYNPANGQIREWALPGGERSLPYGSATDDKDRIWFVETGLDPNRFVGFDPATEEFFSITEVESGGGTIRHMMFHAPSRTIWFGTDTNYIGRARVP